MGILVPEDKDMAIITSSLKKSFIKVEVKSSKINTVDWSKIFDCTSDCSINSSMDSDIRTTATLNLDLSYYEYCLFLKTNNISIDNDELGNNDWFLLNMVLSISFGYKDLTNSDAEIMWYKQGDFVVISSSYSQDEQKLTLTLNDKTVLLNGDRKGSIKASKFLVETHQETNENDKTIIEVVPTRFHESSWQLKTSCPIKSIKNIITPYSTINQISYRDFDTLYDYVNYAVTNRTNTDLTSLQNNITKDTIPDDWTIDGWNSYKAKYNNDTDGWKTVQSPIYTYESNKSIIQFQYPMCRAGIYYFYVVEYYPTYVPNQITDIIDTTLTECSEITDYQLDVIGSEYGTIKTKGLIADSIESIIQCDENSGYIVKGTVNNIYDEKTKNYFDPLYTCLPYDINVDSDITVWSILTKLRDLYPNWQMYFDREGKFICNRISAGLDDPCYLTITDDIVLQKEVSKDFSGFHNITNVFCPDIEPDFYCSNGQRIGDSQNDYYYISSEGKKVYMRIYKLIFNTSFENSKEIEDYLLENDSVIIGFSCNFEGFNGIPDISDSSRPIFLDLEFEALDDSSVSIKYIPVTKTTSENDTTYNAPPVITDTIRYEESESIMFKLIKTDITTPNNTSVDCDFTSYINQGCSLSYIGKMSSIIATAKNDNPNDSYSIESVGSFEQNLSGNDYEKIYTIDDAYARANYENWKSSRTMNTINLNTITIPWLEVNQKIEFEGEQYLVNSISRSYKDNVDSLSLSKFYPLYEDTTTAPIKSSTAPNRHYNLAKYRYIDLSPYTHREIRQGGFV